MNRTLLFVLAFVACCIPVRAWKPLFVGHRGCGQGVENTAEAYRNGADIYNYDGLECDVRVTADGHYVISHDETTTRVGGNLTVASATLAQLQAETYTQTRSGVTYTGHICTVDEYLSICVEKDVFPVLELKWTTGINNNDMSRFAGLAALIDAHGLTQKAVILTSMKKSLEYVRTNFPNLHCQWLCNDNWKGNEDWCAQWNLHPSISTGNFDMFTVRKFHSLGLDVACWTVDALANYKKYAQMGVAMITCNTLMPSEMPELPEPDWSGSIEPLEPLTLMCDTLFMYSRYLGTLPNGFPSGTSSESDYNTAQQAAVSDGIIYANDYGSGTLLRFGPNGRLSDAPMAAGAAQGIAADNAGNLIIRDDGPLENNPNKMVLYRNDGSDRTVIDFTLPFAGRTHFITADGNVFSEEGGRVYFFPNKQSMVNVAHLSLGHLDSISAVGPLSLEGSTAGVVYPLEGTDGARFVYQVRSGGYYLYSGGADRGAYMAGSATTTVPGRNSSVAGALFLLDGHELLLHGSGANYNGGFTVRDMSAAAEPLISLPTLGGGGYPANPSVGAFFSVEHISESNVIVYEYCMGNGYAAYRLYTDREPSVVERVGDDTGNAQPLSCTYYDLMGRASLRPWHGINIVVTRLDNGHTTAERRLMP